MRGRSIPAAVRAAERPSRRATRETWVSTTTPSALPKATPSTTFAVLRATPGSSSSRSIVPGTEPPNDSSIFRQAPRRFRALLR
jgi:2-methylcitrate dehydratase PrpD